MKNFIEPDSSQLLFSAQGSLTAFERLGIIVRALHDTLNEIGAQSALADAASGFPSARERLLHIGELTEKAANLVLGEVEVTMPLLDQLASRAVELDDQWAGVTPVSTEHEQLAAGTREFLAIVQSDCSSARTALSTIMMAQDFQDLTGQLIKKVVTLMERTENDLLKLLIDAAPPGAVVQERKDEVTAGPGAPGSVVLDQDSVDDLLADLGF